MSLGDGSQEDVIASAVFSGGAFTRLRGLASATLTGAGQATLVMTNPAASGEWMAHFWNGTAARQVAFAAFPGPPGTAFVVIDIAGVDTTPGLWGVTIVRLR